MDLTYQTIHYCPQFVAFAQMGSILTAPYHAKNAPQVHGVKMEPKEHAHLIHILWRHLQNVLAIQDFGTLAAHQQ